MLSRSLKPFSHTVHDFLLRFDAYEFDVLHGAEARGMLAARFTAAVSAADALSLLLYRLATYGSLESRRAISRSIVDLHRSPRHVVPVAQLKGVARLQGVLVRPRVQVHLRGRGPLAAWGRSGAVQGSAELHRHGE